MRDYEVVGFGYMGEISVEVDAGVGTEETSCGIEFEIGKRSLLVRIEVIVI